MVDNIIHCRLSWSQSSRYKVAFTAFTQYRDAKAFDMKMRRILLRLKFRQADHDDLEAAGTSIPSEKPRRVEKKWTLMHSYLAIMGGFGIRNSEQDGDWLFPEERKHLALDPGALLWLFETELTTLPDITRSDIEDKRKTDGLAKHLIIVQGRY